MADNATPKFEREQFMEADRGLLVAEASELGFRPGEWPERILIGGAVKDVFVKGGAKFGVSDVITGEVGELEHVLYLQLGGSGLVRIYND